MSNYQYQTHPWFFAQVPPETEDLVKTEFQELGIKEFKTAYRGLSFKAEMNQLHRVCYQSRLATRVLAPLITFDCHSTKYLYKTARQINWQEFLNPGMTFAIFAQVSNSNIRHSRYASLKLKDAIADYFMDKYSKRPSVNTHNPDAWFNLHIHSNKAVISLDCSGGSLHRRGYRQEGLDAPLQETLAAAIIRLSGWNAKEALLDPMCGSGTLLAEALMQAKQLPAAYLRERFGFERLPDYDADIWRKERKKQNARITELPVKMLFGGDNRSEALNATRKNLSKLPQSDSITLKRQDYRDWKLNSPATLVCNPPYGKRLESGGDMRSFYKQLGDHLKQNYQGSRAFIYFGERENLKFIGLRPSWKKALSNGGLDGRLALYELY